MMRRRTLALASLLTLAMAQPAAAGCFPVFGTVRLTPDATCQIAAKHPQGPLFVGTFGLNAPTPLCFSVELKGVPSGTGYAGLTFELPGTPVTLAEAGVPDGDGLPGTRVLFTARSALDLPGGRVYTADAGVIYEERSVEQLVITGGTGSYDGASGVIVARGKIIGSWGPFSGEFCLP